MSRAPRIKRTKNIKFIIILKDTQHTGSKYYIGPLRNKKPLSQKTVICDHYEPKNYGKY